jgi:acyl dehydratase
MAEDFMVSRIFDLQNHVRFAQLSRDYNPIHVDPIVARRTQAGAPIVHGIHSLLWLLEECVAQARAARPRAVNLRAQFKKPIYVGDAASLEITRATSETLRARICVDGTETVVASIGFAEGEVTRAPRDVPDERNQARLMSVAPAPNELSIEEMNGLSGSLPFGESVEQARMMFPIAAGYFGAPQVGALICSSCLVGMVVPGLHSLFVALDVSLVEGAGPPDALGFAVTWVEPRFRRVRIGIRGGGLEGTLETMVRAPPVIQATMANVAPLVDKHEFRGSLALVVGGSRGLGELTAKLIAAAGGKVIITHATGKSDAEAVAREITNAGGECGTMPYDVLLPATQQLGALGERIPTHVYYFATSTIARRKASPFDLKRFDEFNAFYVAGFLELVRACIQLRPQGVRVFYPSTVFVETRPADMTEYAMSKAAAEVLCADIEKYLPRAHVLVRRLPRLLTDQTSALLNAAVPDPVQVLLPIIREMHADTRAAVDSAQPARGNVAGS